MQDWSLVYKPCETIDSQPSAANPTETNPLTHYIIVRPDLPIGVLAAQVTHAAGESSPGNLPPGTYAVVLAAEREKLLELEKFLRENGVKFKAVRESDTPYTGELMSIGLAPQLKNNVRKFLSSLPLLR
jgi:peptidyl-tRNA hydrolase